MARTYKRDSNGRFASTGGARSGRPAAKPVSRGKNRITRDNAGRITSVGGEGATARGGRLRTAAGNKRAVQTARIKGGGGRLRKPISSRPRVSRAEPLMTGGTLAARSSLRRARQKLQTNPTAAQRGAVTRANRYAAAARATPPEFRSAKWAKSEWLKPAAAGRGGGKVDPKKAGSIYNIPPNQLKRYRALVSAEYKHRGEFRDQIDRSFSAYDKRDSQGMAKASKRSDVAFRRSERMRSTLRKLSGAGPEGKAPELPTIQYMRPKSKRDRKDQGYIVRENGRLKSSLYPKGSSGKARRVDLVKMAGIKGVVRAPKAKPSAKSKAPTGPVRPSGRTGKQVAAAYRFKTNQLGKKTAASIGFSAALQRGQRGGFADSAPRLIFRRGKNRQMTLTGGIETVRTGQMREVGRRDSAGKVVLTSRRRKPA